MDGGYAWARGSSLPAHCTIRLRLLLAYVNQPRMFVYRWMGKANKNQNNATNLMHFRFHNHIIVS
jgi:hypothetical protein